MRASPWIVRHFWTTVLLAGATGLWLRGPANSDVGWHGAAVLLAHGLVALIVVLVWVRCRPSLPEFSRPWRFVALAAACVLGLGLVTGLILVGLALSAARADVSGIVGPTHAVTGVLATASAAAIFVRLWTTGQLGNRAIGYSGLGIRSEHRTPNTEHRAPNTSVHDQHRTRRSFHQPIGNASGDHPFDQR
jgi:hypothetical protein